MDAIRPPFEIYAKQKRSYMTDFHLTISLEYQN